MVQDQGAAVTDLLDGLAYGGTKVTSTAQITETVTAQITMDGRLQVLGTTAVAAGDGIVTNDGGTMQTNYCCYFLYIF